MKEEYVLMSSTRSDFCQGAKTIRSDAFAPEDRDVVVGVGFMEKHPHENGSNPNDGTVESTEFSGTNGKQRL